MYGAADIYILSISEACAGQTLLSDGFGVGVDPKEPTLLRGSEGLHRELCTAVHSFSTEFKAVSLRFTFYSLSCQSRLLVLDWDADPGNRIPEISDGATG